MAEKKKTIPCKYNSIGIMARRTMEHWGTIYVRGRKSPLFFFPMKTLRLSSDALFKDI